MASLLDLHGSRIEGLYAHLMPMDRGYGPHPPLDSSDLNEIKLDSVAMDCSWVAPISKGGKVSFKDVADVDWFKTLICVHYRARQGVGEVVDFCFGQYFPSTPAGVRASRRYAPTVDLYDMTLPLSEDEVPETYVCQAGENVVDEVVKVVDSTGLYLPTRITPAENVLTRTTTWPAGTSKKQIATDLLDKIDYHRLTMGWDGVLFSRPKTVQESAEASVVFTDHPVKPGEVYARYDSQFEEVKDLFKVPNRWIAKSQSDGPVPGMVAYVENTDPESPTSYQARGRWVTRTTEESDVDTYSELLGIAKRNMTNASNVRHTVTFTHSVYPNEIRDMVEFHNDEYGIHVRGLVTRMEYGLKLPAGFCKTTLLVREYL